MLDGERAVSMPDELATEEPLTIRLLAAGRQRDIAVTLRTPGADEELAAGFLFCEGVVSRPQELLRLTATRAEESGGTTAVVAELSSGIDPGRAPLERHFFIASACGLCGRASLDGLRAPWRARPGVPRVPLDVLYSLPARLRRGQDVFQATGGLHAAALFTPSGELAAGREDVGRHTALDKLIGWGRLGGRLPFAEGIVLVSGRASYEVAQKCLAAGAPIVCSVSAPSSLAVAVARENGLTLVGFLRDRRLNVYAGEERISGLGPR